MFKVYQAGELRGTIEHAEDAAGFVAFLGDGAEVRYRNKTVWKEGSEKQPAGESYDYAAEVIRINAGLR
jgi:hypothetical protein